MTRFKVYLVLAIGAFLWAIGNVWGATEQAVGLWAAVVYAAIAAAWFGLVVYGTHRAGLPYPVDMKLINIVYAILSVITFGVPFLVTYLNYGDAAAVLWAGIASIGLLGIAYEWSRGRV